MAKKAASKKTGSKKPKVKTRIPPIVEEVLALELRKLRKENELLGRRVAEYDDVAERIVERTARLEEREKSYRDWAKVEKELRSKVETAETKLRYAEENFGRERKLTEELRADNVNVSKVNEDLRTQLKVLLPLKAMEEKLNRFTRDRETEQSFSTKLATGYHAEIIAIRVKILGLIKGIEQSAKEGEKAGTMLEFIAGELKKMV